MITLEELEAKLWAGADELRGSMDASRYKDYMLGLMFYKFLCEKTIEGYKLLTRKTGTTDEIEEAYAQDFAKSPMIKAMLKKTPGYYIEPQYLYNHWVKEIKTGTFALQHVIDGIASFERMIMGSENADDFQNLFSTMNLNDPALGADLNIQSRNIRNLIMLFADLSILELQKNDVIGDAYEYLIGQFALESGKKAGEFYTPHNVSDVIARIVSHTNPAMTSIYDAAVGSGSLLLTVKYYLSEDKKKTLHYYGQELNTATYNLARMNLLLHGVKPEAMTIRNADTLAEDWPEDPKRPNEGVLFDAVVMNPPYSLKKWNKKGLKVSDPRFEIAGVLPPDNKGDYAFLLHGLYHLGPDGTMGIVLPHGVLFRGAAEGTIRSKLIDKNYIDAVIGLPANLFTNTGIPVIIAILKKNRELNSPILMIDASKGFIKVGKTNKLRERDIAKIVDTYLTRKEILGYSHLATLKEIKENGYNLNIPRYVANNDGEIPHDVDAHLLGGIPEKNITDLVALQTAMPTVMAANFTQVRPGYVQLDQAMQLFRQEVWADNWLKAENERVADEVTKYIAKYWAIFKAIGPQSHPNLVELHDNMLQEIKDTLAKHQFMDIYSGYQIIADLWSSSLTQDLKFISDSGFYEAAKITDFIKVKKGKKEEEQLRGKLIPNELVAEVLFADRLAAIKKLEESVEELENQKEAWIERAGTEDTIEAEVLGDCLKEDKSDFDTKELTASYKAAKDKAEKQMLAAVKVIYDTIKSINKDIKTEQEKLAKDVATRFTILTAEETEKLYMRKWFYNIKERIVALVKEPFEQELKTVELLNVRYNQTLTQMDEDIKQSEEAFAKMEKDAELFPAPGEKRPKRRFAGFAGDWEKRKLRNVTDEFKSGSYIAAADIEKRGGYPVFGGNGLRGYTSTYNHDGDFALIGRQGALCGNLNYSKGRAYFTEHAVVVKANMSCNTKFLYYILDNMNLRQYSGQSAQPGLAVGKIIELENMFPSKEEQIKISEYLTNLDNLITLHQRKLAKLQALKKAYLAEMFPQAGDN